MPHLPRIRRAFFLLMLAALFFPGWSHAGPLVADLSGYRVEIDSGFTGTRLFLFGARNDNGDIVVVVRGPARNFMLRRKERIAGLWINRRHIDFSGVPDYYLLAAGKPPAMIKDHGLFEKLDIGQAHLLSEPSGAKQKVLFPSFAEAFFRKQAERRLYAPEGSKVDFMGETLFKTVIEFPDTIPRGKYTAEIYLFSDGELVGVQTTPIQVVKSGFDAFVSNMAHESPMFYGFAAVVVALAAGWGAGRLFERF